MPKICEHCKQPYPDNLASCPNCDVFGVELLGDAPASTPALEVNLGEPESTSTDKPSSAVDLGGDMPGLEIFTPSSSSMHPPPQPSSKGPTRVQGPLPPKPAGPTPPSPAVPPAAGPQPPAGVKPVAAKPPQAPAKPPTGVKAPAAAKPAAPARPAAPTPPQGTSSPLMAKSAAPKPAEPAAPPTVIGTSAGQPTMVATGSAPPTQMAPPGEAGPLPIDPQHAPPGGEPAAPTPPTGKAAPTMLAKAGSPTMLAPPEQSGALPIEGQSPKATMLAKQAAQTKLAPEGTSAMPIDDGPKATKLAKVAPATMLARPEEALPGAEAPQAKQTMLARQEQPQTTLAPTDKPGELPPGMKKTMLPETGKPTQLGAEVYDLPQKKTMLPPGVQQRTQVQQEVFEPPQKKTMLPPGVQQKTQVQQDVYELPDAKATMLGPKPEVTTLVPGEMMKDELGPRTEVEVEAEAGRQPTAAPQPLVGGPRPRMWLRWLGGTVLGLLLGAGALYGYLTALPHDQTRDTIGLLGLKWKEEPDDELAEAIEALEAGNFEKAIRLIEDWSSDGRTPRHYAVLGEARWLRYRSKTAPENLSRDAGEVVQALKDLQEGLKDSPDVSESGSPRNRHAAYWLAHIDEELKELDKAREAYAKAGQQYKDRTFEAAIDRIETRPDENANPDANEPAPQDNNQQGRLTEDETRELLALLLTMQQGGGEDVDEAGFKIWEALRALQKKDFKTAQEALRQAQVIYQKHRFSRIRKSQNPKSDPTDELFGRLLSDALIVAQIKEQLDKYPQYRDKPIAEAVEFALKSSIQPGEALKRIAKQLGLPENAPTEDILKAMDALALDKDIAAMVREALVKGKYLKENEKDADLIKKTSRTLVDDALAKLKMHQAIEREGFKDPNAEVALDMLIKDRLDFIAKIMEIAKKLEDNDYLRPKIDVVAKDDRAEVVTGVDRVIDAARSPLASAISRTARNLVNVAGRTTTAVAPTYDLASQLAAAQARIVNLNFRLMRVRDARKMMEYWPAILQDARHRKEILDDAAADARHVLDPEFGADELARAQAHTVQGMAQRNGDQFDEARASLQQALKVNDAGAWRTYAEAAWKELTDPAFYYIPQADSLANIGRFEQAVELLKSGVAAFPKEGRLLALRALVQLELAKDRVEGRLTSKDPLVQAARQDAQAAIAAGSVAEGNFALGRVAEDLDDRLAAEKFYRQALAAHPNSDNSSSRYRVALGRILLKLNPVRPTPIPPPPRRVPAEDKAAPEPNKVGLLNRPAPQPLVEEQEEPAAATADARLQAESVLLALLLPLQVVADDEDPDLDEIIRLADEAIKAKNYEGYLIKARALARKGQWTRALREYSEGLKYLIPANYANGLAELVDGHPAINLPDSLRVPDPLRAEKHYGNGLRAYFSGQYAAAEAEFIEAYRNNGQDARYLYYLGLSRLPQRDKTQAATVNFEMAALLERQNKPSPAAINAALERVQGPLRQRLQAYRP